MKKFKGVADTLYIPLTARIYVSEHFPEFFHDEKALSLKEEMPYEEIAAKSGEYFHMAGACRFYNTDRMIQTFMTENPVCNVVNIGCGLETAFFRIHPGAGVKFYEMDLPAVIDARRRILGESENDILLPGDMFDFAWAEGIDKSLPTMVTAIGVLQYFEEERVIGFLKQLKRKLKLYTRIAMKVVDESRRKGFLVHLRPN